MNNIFNNSYFFTVKKFVSRPTRNVPASSGKLPGNKREIEHHHMNSIHNINWLGNETIFPLGGQAVDVPGLNHRPAPPPPNRCPALVFLVY
jgi:hypothetical protein